MNLRTYLNRASRCRPCLRTPFGEWTAEDLLAYEPEAINSVQGRRVAIQLTDAGIGLQALAAFDGLVEAVTLLPSSLHPQYLPNLLEDAGCDLLLTDKEELPSKLPVSIIYRSLSEITGTQPFSVKNEVLTEWHLVTSGTTGTPKLVSHTLPGIIRSIKLGQLRGEKPRWGLLYEYTRFAGLQVLLQAVLSGACLIVPAIGASLSDKIRELVDAGCSHLSATPTLWRSIAMVSGSEALPLRQVTLGGEIADDRLLKVLSNMYPNARITHIYAATEAGVGFSVNDHRSGFPTRYLTSPPCGVSLRIEDGRLYVKNTDVRTTYVGTSQNFGTDDGWIDTGDNVDLVGDRVYFLGRASGQLNVGGNKVHPEEIERALIEHPEVKMAKVYGRPSSIMGTIIQADVVLATQSANNNAACQEIKEFLKLRVAKEMVPAIIRVVDRLDVTSSGKLIRMNA